MVRWLVVGVGDIATRRVIPAIRKEPRSKLVGVVTRKPAKADALTVPCWRSLSDALRESDSDAVYVSTPVFLHAPQTIQSLEAGKHVICEKPMALNYPEARSMQLAAEQMDKLLSIAYYRRMYPKVQRARELLAAGAIGTPVLAEATSHGWFYPEDGYRAWLIDPGKAGAGPLFDVACHRIDLMNYLFGGPTRITGQVSTLIQPTDVEDNATVLVNHASGVRSIVDVRWHSRVTRDEFRVRGTEGELELSPLNGPVLRYAEKQERLPPHENIHIPAVAQFVDAIEDGVPLMSSGKTALETEWVLNEVLRQNGAALRC